MPVAITVAELKAQLNLNPEDDDALLSLKIDAAEAYAASYTGIRSLTLHRLRSGKRC